MKRIQNRKGNSVVTMPFVLVFGMVCIIMMGTFVVSAITPFIWYEKLHMVANRYLFIVEKYGYLTEIEQQHLLQDLQEQGFEKEKVKLEVTDSIKGYGEPIFLTLSYPVDQKLPVWLNGSLGKENNEVWIRVHKDSFCKR